MQTKSPPSEKVAKPLSCPACGEPIELTYRSICLVGESFGEILPVYNHVCARAVILVLGNAA